MEISQSVRMVGRPTLVRQMTAPPRAGSSDNSNFMLVEFKKGLHSPHVKYPSLDKNPLCVLFVVRDLLFLSGITYPYVALIWYQSDCVALLGKLICRPSTILFIQQYFSLIFFIYAKTSLVILELL